MERIEKMNEIKFCPKCGMKIDNKKFCIHCGYNNQDENIIDKKNQVIKKVSDASKILTALLAAFSYFNLITIVPLSFNFSIIWLLFGGLSGDIEGAKQVEYLSAAYPFASIALVIAVTYTLVKKRYNPVTCIIITAIIYFIAYIILNFINYA